MKSEFPPELSWFADFTVRLDLGFQGFGDLYVCQKLHIPIKRKRVSKGESNELTEQNKAQNKKGRQERIFVEHSIGGMKRYRILVHRNRIKSKKVLDQIIGVCAGLWNFILDKSL